MNRIIYTTVLAFFWCTWSMAQGLAYKEIKTIEKKYPCTNKNNLTISGERTYLNLSSWDEDYIKASINVISKFTDKKQASADLEKVNVVFEKDGKSFIYSNALRIKSPADKPKSNITVTLDLIVPHGMKVEITNAFGAIEISGKFKMVDIQSDFSAIDIYDFYGSSDILTKYGDINIDGYGGEMNIQADRSNITMENVTGKTEVEASYGELEIFYPRRSAFYNVNASYSPISLYIQEDFEEAIALTCKECSIMGQDDSIPLKISKEGENSNGIISNTKGKKPTGLISSEIENIKIKTYKRKSKTN